MNEKIIKKELKKYFRSLSRGIKIIEKQQKKIKKRGFQEGGISHVHDCGIGEKATLPDGSQVLPNDIISKLKNKNDNIEVSTFYNGEESHERTIHNR